jgi:hypothetical protein
MNLEIQMKCGGRRKLKRGYLAITLAASLVSLFPARGDSQTGANGSNGAAGYGANPGTNGGNGTDGSAANANSQTSSLTNSSTARGGTGGAGGNGGVAIPGNVQPGMGGNGGNGGYAAAIAGNTAGTNSSTVNSTSSAGGGNGGIAGIGGTSTAYLSIAGNSGAGGSASANAWSLAGGTSTVVLSSSSQGGNGGSTPTNSGLGGNGGNGGDALTNASVTAGANCSISLNNINAVGGLGGNGWGGASSGGNGGTATIGAIILNCGTGGTVQVYTAATGGRGGTGYNGGKGGDGVTINPVSCNVGDGSSVMLTEFGIGGGGGSTLNSTGNYGLPGNGYCFQSLSLTSGASISVTLIGRGGAGAGGALPVGQMGGISYVGGLIGNSGSGAVTLYSLVRGGQGGSVAGVNTTGGNGGVEPTSVVGAFSINGTVTVNQTVTGGSGGNGYNAGNGADAILVNAASGTTSGTLVITQSAQAGNAGIAQGGNWGIAGNASSSFTYYDSTANIINCTSSATAGNYGISGGSAIANINVTGRAIVYAAAIVYGATGVSDGRNGQIGNAYATSITGGPVHVTSKLYGGNGASYGVLGNFSGNGADAILSNSVTGDTTGLLYLVQAVTGGAPGASLDGSGHAGNATSLFNLTKSCPSISVESDATGGAGATAIATNAGHAGLGGDATAINYIYNPAGSAIANVAMFGGNGGVPTNGATTPISGGNGGTAFATATAISSGFGIAQAYVQGRGGTGGAPSGFGGSGGDGGSASGTALAIATLGPAAATYSVNQYSIAVGGSPSGTYAIGSGGNGGSSTGSAMAISTGSNSSTAYAYTLGANGGFGYGPGYHGGNGGAAVLQTLQASSGSGPVTLYTNVYGGGGGGGLNGASGGNGGNASVTGDISGTTAGKLTFDIFLSGGSGGNTSGTGKLGNGGNGGNAYLSLNISSSQATSITALTSAYAGYGGQVYSGPTGHGGDSGTAYGSLTIYGIRDISGYMTVNGGFAGTAAAGIGNSLAAPILGPIYANSSGGGQVLVYAAANSFGPDESLNNAVNGDTTGSLTLTQIATSVGNASSSLTRATTSTSLTLQATAQSQNTSGLIGTGMANAYANSTNSGGTSRATTVASGVSGASDTAIAIALGNYNSFANGSASLSTGFNATSKSIAYSYTSGNGTATATDFATGGDAQSTASATNVGTLPVIATATARSQNPAAQLGAVARASAYSMGGSTTADAIAMGASSVNVGFASATSVTSSGWISQIQSTAYAPFSGTSSHARSFSTVGGVAVAPTNAVGLQSAAFQTALPDQYDSYNNYVANTTHGRAVINLGQGTGLASTVLSHITLGGQAPIASTIATFTSAGALTIDNAQLSQSQDLILDLVSPIASGAAGFSSLRFRVLVAGATSIDQTFNNVPAANAFFTDTTIDLGGIAPIGGSSLTIGWEMDLTSQSGGGYTADVLLANATQGAGVPEPSVLGPSVLSLMVLTRRCRKRRYNKIAESTP